MKPVVIESIARMQDISSNLPGKVGFVPTMGYLHDGHLSLVKAAKEETDVTVVSIYVNPSQFSPDEDLESYPRDFDRDIELLDSLNVDYVFFPDDKEMYPKNYHTWVTVDELTKVLCGASRPSHFKGVTTIVAKLVNIVQPDLMFMGEKDFQQIAVLKRMLADLNFKTKIVPCPIIRESDGLAMSSRNKYLNEDQRKNALCLHQSIKLVQQQVNSGNKDVVSLRKEVNDLIASAQGKIDYIEFRQADNLLETEVIDNHSRIFLAVYMGKTRLIDNAPLVR